MRRNFGCVRCELLGAAEAAGKSLSSALLDLEIDGAMGDTCDAPDR